MTDYQDLVTRLRSGKATALWDAADAIETLTRERDEARKEARDAQFAASDIQHDLTDAELDRDALRALLREAGEALEAFSANADIYADDAPGTLPVTEYLSRFRRARAVLARIKEGLNDSK